MPFRNGHLTVVGTFPESVNASSAIARLDHVGFEKEDLSVVMPARPKSELPGIHAHGIPRIGPFLAAGPLYSALERVGIAGTLAGIGVSVYEARRYEGFVKEGHILIGVHVLDDRWASLAKRLFKESGAREITVADEKNASTVVAGPTRPMTRADDYQFHK
jgi:hypothetical protein